MQAMHLGVVRVSSRWRQGSRTFEHLGEAIEKKWYVLLEFRQARWFTLENKPDQFSGLCHQVKNVMAERKAFFVNLDQVIFHRTSDISNNLVAHSVSRPLQGVRRTKEPIDRVFHIPFGSKRKNQLIHGTEILLSFGEEVG